MNQYLNVHTSQLSVQNDLIVLSDLTSAVIGSLVEAAVINLVKVERVTEPTVQKRVVAQRKVFTVKSHIRVSARKITKKATNLNDHEKATNLNDHQRATNPSDHEKATNPSDHQRATNLNDHEKATNLNDLIAAKEVIHVKAVEKESTIQEAKEMCIVSGIKVTCGNTVATNNKNHICRLSIFETLFKREYDKKGFFYCVEKL
ncbi:hypothetical protein [Bacillus sp. NPDC077027]|uniref:hypothetical protein n=1 Tax=Bacillus sp. NPDC077027 TaxID=3390548 RepID=UPI003D0901A8